MLMVALSATTMSAYANTYYGYCPHECTDDEIIAIGSGANAFMEAAIRLDPSGDPLMASLKGQKILGVRCYLRTDYKQKSKGYSCVRAYSGSLETATVSKVSNFLAGWNEVYFDEPMEIGSEPIYVGYRVYETQGEPFPVVAIKDASAPGSCYLNQGRKEWIEDASRGVLLIEAILDSDDSAFGDHVIVSPFKRPTVVAPSSEFTCRLYIHNQSALPIEKIEYTGFDANSNVTSTYSIELPQPLQPYGSVTLGGKLRAPGEEGADVPLYVRATSVDGRGTDNCMTSKIGLYVSADVFFRVPLIEEFTGLKCVNCPFMFYYLDMALEKYAEPHVYVAHHAGFYPDVLTKPCDESLLYLFGSGSPYNPAVMYDRRVMEGCDVPVMGSGGVASTEPYDTRIAEAMQYPAMASVLVDSEISSDKATCRVYGKVSKASLDFKDNLYVTAYLLEDNIPATGMLSQMGMEDIPEDAPADLPDRFRHRGVIRHCYNTGDNGDKLQIEEDGSFDISFDAATPDTRWNLSNCEVVAFVHKVNADDMTDNYVLNAGAARFNEYTQNGVIGLRDTSSGGPRVFVTPGRQISTTDPDASLEIFSLSGMSCDPSAILAPGVYMVRCTLPDNRSFVSKIAVR